MTVGGDVVVASTSLAVRCAFLTYRLPTDWYFPAGEPRGLVWAQHGFTESRKVWADFATRAARAGFLVVAPTLPSADLFGCTVQNLGNNTRFLDHIAEALGAGPAGGRGDDRGGSDGRAGTGILAASYVAALRKSAVQRLAPGASTPGTSTQEKSAQEESAQAKSAQDHDTPTSGQAAPLPIRIAFVGHSAGCEAVLYLARRLTEVQDPSPPNGRRASGDAGGPMAPDRFEPAGVVLADPVTSLVDRTMAASLHALVGAGLPVLTVAAPPNPCNARHRGVATVAAALASRRFIGVQLVTGSHADVLGASVGALERRVCGTPAPGNIEAAQALAVGWLGDMLAAGDDRAEGDVAEDGSGSSSPSDFRPQGATYQALLGAGVIAQLG